MSSHAVQMGRHSLAVRGDDFYQTPRCAVDALLRHEPLLQGGPLVWEPACGLGAISEPLIEAGCTVVSTDLVQRGYGLLGGVDFLTETAPMLGARIIVTNPPFKLADEFIRHGLQLCDHVIVLLRWAYAEGDRRSDLIDGHLVRVWLGRERLPFMHREGYDGPRNSSSGAPFGWFVFSRSNELSKAPGFIVRRVSWRGA